MLFTINKEEERKNLYHQIYDSLKGSIMNGRLQANEKLPSKRTLAEQLKVSVNTVTNAYEQLLAEGYIYTEERKGYYVENITPLIREGRVNNQPLPSDLKERIQTKEGWLSLSHRTSSISMFPFREWMKCQQKVITDHQRELSEYGHFQGPYILRQTIARMIARTRGVVCEPEQIIIGAGFQYLIRNLIELSNQNIIAGVEDPGYIRFYALLKNMGVDVRAYPLDENGIAIKKVDSNINYLFVTPSHQFPTGKIMPITRRIELLNWSIAGPDRYIIEDDYDSEFKYETDNIPSLQSIDRNQRVIYIGTFSKTIFPGMRISYMVLPPDMLRQYRRQHANLKQTGNLLALYTLHYFIETGAYARHVKRMNHHYEIKRKELMRCINDCFGKTVTIEDTRAGLHFLARFTTNKTYEEVEEKARDEKLEIFTMRQFKFENRADSAGAIDLVMGFADIGEEQIPEAVARLKRVLG
ncbi:PLP-dependent aminotransferase family protein [Bacillus sp. JJ1773]|uniref:MocR-like transcriptional regulator GabR n=1 Tax=Bacillus sp. JJ1773 TaxID=3122965 RepID=UPI002FFEABD3